MIDKYAVWKKTEYGTKKLINTDRNMNESTHGEMDPVRQKHEKGLNDWHKKTDLHWKRG